MYLAAVFVVHSVVRTNSNSLERSIPLAASIDVRPHRNEPIPFSFETLINLIRLGFRMKFQSFGVESLKALHAIKERYNNIIHALNFYVNMYHASLK